MRRAFVWSFLVLVIAGILVSFMLSLSKHEPATVSAPVTVRQAPADRPQAPSFLLTDQFNRPFDSASLKGQVWIADFIFTSCGGACPPMTQKMAQLQQKLPAAVKLVSVTVDPARDTPQVLAEYGAGYGAQPDRWFFLTGPAEQIFPLIQKGFRLSVAEGGSPEEPVTHSSRFVLVDRSGGIHGYYDSTDPAQFERLVQDAAAL